MVCLIYFHFYMLVNVLLYRSSLKTVENLEVVKALPADRLLLETGQTGDVCVCVYVWPPQLTFLYSPLPWLLYY